MRTSLELAGLLTTILVALLPCPSTNLLLRPAQNSTEAFPMPNDPAAILHTAAAINGLAGPGLSPWHLRAAYQTFDTKGHPQASGTYEEFWVSDKKYKRSYTSPSFTQTDFGTERGLYRVGNQKWAGLLETTLRTELVEPMPAAIDFRSVQLGKSHRSVNKMKLQCVTLESQTVFLMRESYCFDQDKPVLRFASSGGGWHDSSYGEIVAFQSRFVARDIRVADRGRPHIIVHVDVLEPMTMINESDFAPPADAVSVPIMTVIVPQETMNALCLMQVPPHYPPEAKSSHIEGAVVVQVTIGKDGQVRDAQAISGRNELRAAAVGAVRGWRYRPFIVLGEPREVQSAIELHFVLQ